MTDWTDRPLTTVVQRLTPVPPARRDALLHGPRPTAGHGAAFDAVPALREIERGGAAPSAALGPEVRVLAWNVERLRHIDDFAATLQAENADVLLLCEVDRGMARTGNRDTVADLAGRLGMGFVYALEWLELGLGDVNEQRDHAGQMNAEGFHGAAILSRAPLDRPFLIRIDRRGDWFDGTRTEPRVGGTIALGAVMDIAGRDVAFVSVHLESHDGPEARAADMARLLAQVEMAAPGAPAVLGGDFNCATIDREVRVRDSGAWAALVAADPMRPLRPAPWEPMFAAAADAGYGWEDCNVPDVATTRFPAGSPRIPAKIDWFFTRGLSCQDAAILPAVRADGTPSSDHEGLAVTISLPR
jgi:endonuclease/exonuclease/phosphatase family metal-dependent hydrolase